MLHLDYSNCPLSAAATGEEPVALTELTRLALGTANRHRQVSLARTEASQWLVDVLLLGTTGRAPAEPLHRMLPLVALRAYTNRKKQR